MNSNKRLLKGRSIIEFPESFVVFDIETTGLDPRYDEIIEIGAIKVQENVITDTFSVLIKPQYEISPFITELTGITNELVRDKEPIEVVLPEFMAFIEDYPLVGHNVNFDINFIYDNLINIGLKPLENNFIDTLRIAKRVCKKLHHHRLKDLAIYYHIDDTGSHRALKDVEITLDVLNELKKDIIEEYGSLEAFTTRSKMSYYGLKASDITSETSEFDEENPFFQKYVAFTGVLEKLERKEAMQQIVNLGGFVEDNVTSKTNYLILGNNDYNPILRGKKSSKLKKAEQMQENGYDILIISENVFYDMLEDKNSKQFI